MTRIEHLLEKRITKNETKDAGKKVRALATQSNNGSLSSFSTLFGSSPLSSEEKTALHTLLQEHTQHNHSKTAIEIDLQTLSQITAEIRSISHQSIILHGERIQQAQNLLSSYQEGAFSAWLVRIYGNRQTPYNFLLYFEFYMKLEHHFKEILEKMPKQAVYTLASRSARHEEKLSFISSYSGQTKDVLLQEIRKKFPLSKKDGRRRSPVQTIYTLIDKIKFEFIQKKAEFSDSEKCYFVEKIKNLLDIVSVL